VTGSRTARWWLVALALAGLLVIPAAIWASGSPDGLERVAEDLGFLGEALSAPFRLLPDYTIPGLNGTLSTILAGLIGVAVVFGVLWVVGRILTRRRQP
jgi:hypothetical protein